MGRKRNKNETRYSFILFDLDGTLTDSVEGVTRSVQYALKQFGINEDPEDLRSFIGPPLLESFQNIYGFSKKDAWKAIDCFRDYYREKGIYENRLYPHVPEMLQELTGKGLKLYLATSKMTRFAEIILRHFAIDSYFTFITGATPDGSRVEKDDVISYLLSQNSNLDKSKTVMVGDRKHDVNGATRCGLDSIAVTYGYGSIKELREEKPSYLAHSVSELKELLLS